MRIERQKNQVIRQREENVMRAHRTARIATLVMIVSLILISTSAFSQQAKPFAGTHIVALLYSSPEGNALRKLIETGKFQALTGISVEVTMLSW